MVDYVQSSNIIPSVKTTGKFTALTPFDSVFDPNLTYTVMGIRTIEELEANKENIFEMMLKPVGVAEADSQALLKRCKELNGVILVFGNQGEADIYVPSTFIPALPDSGAVKYERLCLIVDLGAVPGFIKERINTVKSHINDYVTANIGITSSVSIGSLPSSQFVSQAQADAFEATRQNKIANSVTDAAQIRVLTDKVAKQEAYIKKLEDALTAAVPVPPAK